MARPRRANTCHVLGRVGLGAVCAALAVAVVAPSAAPARGTCGVERWAVKTMTDARAGEVDLHPRATTIGALRSLPAPHIAPRSPRQAGERFTYRVTAHLVEMKLEADSDIHLVVADPASGRTMIAEFPASYCTVGASALLRRDMTASRDALIAACGDPSASSFHDLHGSGTLTGVAFFDVLHGQTGVAPNGIELHPVLRLRVASCR